MTVETITPWRLDVARNRPLIWSPPMLTSACAPTWTRCSSPAGGGGGLDARGGPAAYRYTWNFLPDGREGWSTGTTRCTAGGAAGG